MRVLVAGESWVSVGFHVKGVDHFSMDEYSVGADAWLEVLREVAEVDYLPGHEVPRRFPQTLESLRHYAVVLLSDIGANSLLLHPDTWVRGERTPNRLRLLADYVRGGGGLAMVGGYLSFQGIQGVAGYHGTPVEEVLPVTIEPFDDRQEAPEGLDPEVVAPYHPCLRGVPSPWPYLLGMNRLHARPEAEVLATAGGLPLLAVREFPGGGRTAAWASDIGPHWCPSAFVAWPGYAALWQGVVRWLAGNL